MKITNLKLTAFSLSLLVVACNKEAIKQTAVQSTLNTNELTLTSNLVAWYTFDGDALDHSGNGNDVVFNNAKPAAGKNGLANTAYRFNGTSNYMKVSNSASLQKKTAGVTLMAVVKPTGFYMGACHGNWIMMKGNYFDSRGNYLLAFDDQKYYNYDGCSQPILTDKQNFYGSCGNGPNNSLGAVSNDYIQKQWYTIVYTCDGKVGNIYIDGQLKGTKVNTAFGYNGNTDPLFIGRLNENDYPYWFNGLIDEIRIYNRALTAQEVSQL